MLRKGYILAPPALLLRRKVKYDFEKLKNFIFYKKKLKKNLTYSLIYVKMLGGNVFSNGGGVLFLIYAPMLRSYNC